MMVLENSSDSTGGDPFHENPPASDDDPYSSSVPQASPSNYKIDTTKLPRPIPIIGTRIGFDQDFFLKILDKRIQNHTQILKRPPNQEEVEAISYWVAKQISIFSYGSPLGLLAGTWRGYTTNNTFRFPFWKPNLETFNPHIFPSERMVFLRGNRAVMVWHALRWVAYGFMGRFFGNIIFGSYSMSVAAVGEMTDPRLKAMTEATRQQTIQKRGGLPGAKMPGTTGSPANGRTGRGNTPPVDDASPTDGMPQEESFGFGNDTDHKSNGPRTQEQPQPDRWPRQSKPAPVPMQRTETKDDPFYTFDDASPTGGAGARADAPPQQPPRQGSAWDRVRQGAGRQTDSGQAQEQSRGWSGVRQAQSQAGDKERSLGKSEAQEVFDAQVERERRGGDFSGSGDADS